MLWSLTHAENHCTYELPIFYLSRQQYLDMITSVFKTLRLSKPKCLVRTEIISHENRKEVVSSVNLQIIPPCFTK